MKSTADRRAPTDRPIKFYFAGKIAGGDANYDPGWRQECFTDGDYYTIRHDDDWPLLRGIVMGGHDYVGPYLIDNWGGHQPFEENEHGRTNYPDDDGDADDGLRMVRRLGITVECFSAIDRCDVVFAWINRLDVYGTLVELGYAKAKGKAIWIGFFGAPCDGFMLEEEMWFVREMADDFFLAADPAEALGGFLRHLKPDLRTMPYADYLKTEHWQQVRKAALEAADHRCQLCNSTFRLNVHHRTYERRGCEEPGDVTVLCHGCHAKFHDKLPNGSRA